MKILLFVLLVSGLLVGQSIQVQQGWQLLGAMDDIKTSSFDNTCVKTVWGYEDGTWKLHIANNATYQIPNTISTDFATIQKGQGYWVKGYDNCIIPDSNQSGTNITTQKLRELLSGKTFYTTVDDAINTSESLTFSNDASSVMWNELKRSDDDELCHGSASVIINGSKLILTPTSDSCDDVNTSEKDIISLSNFNNSKYLIAYMDGKSSRLYYNKADADDYYITHGFTNYIKGQTRYFAAINGATGYRIFNKDGTYTGKFKKNYSLSGTYTIDETNDVLTLHNNITNNTLIFTHNGYDYGGERFSLVIKDVNNTQLVSTMAYWYSNASARDNGRAQYIADHY